MGQQRIKNLLARLNEMTEAPTLEQEFLIQVNYRRWAKGKTGKQRIEELLQRLNNSVQ